MSRRTRKGRQSELGISTRLTRGSSSTQGSEGSNSSGLRLEKSGNHAESVVTMKTRVAVRDQTPHRFQIIPLREVKDSVDTQPEKYTTPSTPGNRSLLSPSGYDERSIPPPMDTPRKENSQRQNVDTYQNSFLTAKNLLATKSELAPPYIVSKKVLTEMDLNRDPTTSTEPSPTSLGLLSKASSSRNGPHLAAPHTLNNEFRMDGKHRTFATFGSTNVSEISQLFCSDSSESQPVRRRNRSLTVTTIRSDTSVAMSDIVEAEAKLKRRHAIYRESHMSYLDKSKNPRRNDTASDRESLSSLSQYSGEMFDQQNHLEDTPKPLQGAFVLRASKPRVSPTAKLVTNHSNPKGPMHEIRNLKLVKAAKSDKLVLSGIRGDLVYPPIILGLFRDIDEAIHDWNRV